jgi:hypothetical protein
MIHHSPMIRHSLARLGRFLIYTLPLLILLAPEWPAYGDEEHQLMALVGLRQFDFLIWESQAFTTKAQAILSQGHTYLSQAERKTVVLDYLDLIAEIGRLEREINELYINPQITDANTASRQLQNELTNNRATLAQLQPLAEAIIQDQIATVLAAEGFTLLQQTWPPVMMHMSPLPSVLIVSPRSHIQRKHQVTLIPGLSTPAMDELETAVHHNLDLSALIVPIGGLGTFPSMITESSDINWLMEVVTHEWAHTWLGFKPLGLYYGLDPNVRIINETAVSLIDQEIARRVVARYYPEHLPPPPAPALPQPEPEPIPLEPPPFDFRDEMATTRILADKLLAEGHIEAAETYMEERRKLFVANGYHIRKLNQAYFAFYGAYADQPGGATGLDPIGPLLRDIRQHSDTIYQFLNHVSPISSFADLQHIHQQITSETTTN